VSTYTVTTDVAKIFDSPTGKKWLLYNTGTATAYASKFPNASFGEGFPLAPAGSLHWHESDSLYLYTMTGSTTVVVSDAVLDVFDANQLASQIASALTGGSLLTNSGIATAIYNQGMLENMLIAHTTYSYASGTSDPVVDTDFGKASTFKIQASWGGVGAGTIDIGITIAWYADAAYTQFVTSKSYLTDDICATIVVRDDVITPYARITYIRGVASTLNVYVDTYGVRMDPALVLKADQNASGMIAGTGDDNFYAWVGTIGAGVTYNDYIHTPGRGKVVLSLFTSTAIPAGAVRLGFFAVESLQVSGHPRIAGVSMPGGTAAGTEMQVEFYAPNSGFHMLLENTTAVAVTIRASVTWEADITI
jgi:hypothetical protein